MYLDYIITKFLSSFAHKNALVDTVVVFFAHWAILILVFAFILFVFFYKDLRIQAERKNFIINAFFAGLFLVMINIIFGTFMFRARPFVLFDSMALINNSWLDNSFPSVHSMLSFLMASIIFFVQRKIGIVFFVLAGFIAFGRVIGGVHFISDIIAGAMLGVITGYFVYQLSQVG